MAISINSIESLQEYLNRVLKRAEHHAGNVEGVSLTLLGAVMWKSDGEISVREYDGKPANMIWFFVKGNKYVLAYNHEKGKIELKNRTHRGEVKHEFNNESTYQGIIEAFNSL